MSNNKNAGGWIILVVVIVIAIGVMWFGKIGLFPGNGSRFLPGDGNQEEDYIEENKTDNDETETDIPSTIVVSIIEDQVTINGHPVTNEDELRQYIEDYNNDSRVFVLEEDQSILETFNWVKNTFTTLDIELKNSN